MIVVLAGTSGIGKTTIGNVLAARLGWTFEDSDALHSPAQVAKMRSGQPLTDADRWPWLATVAAWMDQRIAAGESAVIACSALKQAYRDRLATGGSVRFVYLKGDAKTIGPRLAGRTGHFMPPSLLESQFATLEAPAAAIVIDIVQPIAAQVAAITRALREELPA